MAITTSGIREVSYQKSLPIKGTLAMMGKGI